MKKKKKKTRMIQLEGLIERSDWGNEFDFVLVPDGDDDEIPLDISGNSDLLEDYVKCYVHVKGVFYHQNGWKILSVHQIRDFDLNAQNEIFSPDDDLYLYDGNWDDG